jgi:hypothetical protein
MVRMLVKYANMQICKYANIMLKCFREKILASQGVGVWHFLKEGLAVLWEGKD